MWSKLRMHSKNRQNRRKAASNGKIPHPRGNRCSCINSVPVTDLRPEVKLMTYCACAVIIANFETDSIGHNRRKTARQDKISKSALMVKIPPYCISLAAKHCVSKPHITV